MDLPRPDLKRRKRIRQTAIAVGGVLLLAAVAIGIARLEPAAPGVARAAVWTDKVRRGEMLREVRAPGTLLPLEIRWIAAQTGGRVERVLVRPGAVVEPETVLAEMSNSELLAQLDEARYNLEAAEAELEEMRLTLRSAQLDQRAALAVARAEYESAQLQAEAEAKLAADGIVSAIDARRSELLAEQRKVRLEIEQDRLEQFADSIVAQGAARDARVAAVRNTYERRLDEVDSLEVRAGLAGVVQEILVEAGQRVTLGANIARVARPDDLQAELQVPESQARDVQIGQRVAVDTRNAVVEGRVVRIDPAVRSGAVQVDVELVGKLPRGARPDLSVDGIIEIERLDDVIYTGRPAYAQPHTTVGIFKLTGDGHAVRVPVELGRTSVSAVEIVQGLAEGDEVILSDTSAWDEYDRIRLD